MTLKEKIERYGHILNTDISGKSFILKKNIQFISHIWTDNICLVDFGKSNINELTLIIYTFTYK